MERTVGAAERQRRQALVALGIAFALAYVLYLTFTPGSDRSVTAISDVIQLVVPLGLAMPMAIVAARRTTGRERTAWYLLAAGCLAWALGQAAWTWFEVIRDVDPFPSVADVGFLAAVPLLLAGVAVYPARVLALSRARVVVDAALIAVAALAAAYGSFLSEIYEHAEGTTLERAIALAYPIGDLVIVATATALLARRVEGWRGAIGFVILGIGALAVADSSFAYLVSRGDYTDGATDAGWAIGFLLIAYAATVRPAGRHDEPSLPRGPTIVEAALPLLPVAASSVVLAVRGLSGAGIGPFLGVAGAAVGLFVVARTVIIQVENARLTSDLALTVEALQLREDELHHQAFHDSHTGLANRALFRDRVEHAVARRAGQDVVVLFIDLDDFKTVNDSLGHDVGDRLLVLVAERLRACVRPADTVARLGGDEFGVLIDESDAADRADHLAARILAAFQIPFDLVGRQLRVYASIGVALGSTGTSTAAGLLQDADLAMYAAKAAGKATYMRFHPSLRDEATDRMELIHDLNRALEHGGLEAHYQPMLRLSDGQLAGYEALIRWRHPTRGLLDAAAFMDLAEETGAAVPIGWWLLEQGCVTLAAAGPAPDGGSLWLSVNLSPRQLRDPAVAGTVAAILGATGFEARRLYLELTEASVLEGDETVDAMRELQALGIRLAVDGFGTGYSSLSALAALPLDGVKIDAKFVASMQPDGVGDGDMLIRAVTQLADGLDLRVVAEGVTHAFQLERLMELGCHGAQGPLLGEPAPTLGPITVSGTSAAPVSTA